MPRMPRIVKRLQLDDEGLRVMEKAVQNDRGDGTVVIEHGEIFPKWNVFLTGAVSPATSAKAPQARMVRFRVGRTGTSPGG